MSIKSDQLSITAPPGGAVPRSASSARRPTASPPAPRRSPTPTEPRSSSHSGSATGLPPRRSPVPRSRWRPRTATPHRARRRGRPRCSTTAWCCRPGRRFSRWRCRPARPLHVFAVAIGW